jgi:uncharacterized membrane protein YedE/YeeE
MNHKEKEQNNILSSNCISDCNGKIIQENKSSETWAKWLIVIPSGFVIGVCFGIALEKSKVYLPEIITKQMLFENFTMIKMFLSATAVGSIIFGTLEQLNLFQRTPRPPLTFGFNLLGYGSNILGGLLLGIGMGLSGACPGTVAAQIGAGVKNALYVFAGGFAGSLLFGTIEPHLKKKLKLFGQRGQIKTLDKIFKVGVLFTSWTFGALLLSIVFKINQWKPWQSELNEFLMSPLSNSLLPSISDPVWSPIISGILIGLLQIPSVLIAGNVLGTSSSYMTLICHCVKTVDRKHEKLPHFKRYTTLSDFWQAFLLGGIVLGSYLSSTMGKTYGIGTSPSTPLISFIGGSLLLIGARTAGGCTSGHGISGIAKLSTASFVTVTCMFLGAIATSFFMFK